MSGILLLPGESETQARQPELPIYFHWNSKITWGNIEFRMTLAAVVYRYFCFSIKKTKRIQ